MWEVRVQVTISQAEGDEWNMEVPAATLKVKTDHTARDEQGEYLPDDEVTADTVYEAVKEWQDLTGIHEDDNTVIGWEYEPADARKVK